MITASKKRKTISKRDGPPIKNKVRVTLSGSHHFPEKKILLAIRLENEKMLKIEKNS